jgi:hypothetical protein
MSLLSPRGLAPHTSDKSHIARILSPVRVGFALSDETVRYAVFACTIHLYSMHSFQSRIAPPSLWPLPLRQTMQYQKPTMHLRANSVPAMLLRVMQGPDHCDLQMPKEIHVRKLLHLLHVSRLGDLLVIEENPRCGPLVWQLLANEGHVVTASTNLAQLM